MLSKLDYTQQILNRLPDDRKTSVENALSTWWQDLRLDSGLRLSTEGYAIFNIVGITAYEFELPIGTHARANTLLILSRKLTCPYHITIGKKPKLTLYGSKEATMYSLYGNIDKFIAGINRF